LNEKVPKDSDVLLQGINTDPVPYSVDDFPLPTSKLVQEVDAYVKVLDCSPFRAIIVTLVKERGDRADL